MTIRKELGRIIKAEYGFGGYQDAQFGLSVTLGGECWGVCDFIGSWDKRSKGATYSQAEFDAGVVTDRERVIQLVKSAKKSAVSGLAGVPVEVTFEGNTLKSWRILTEVLA